MEFDAKNGRMKETFGVLKAAKSSIGRAMVSIKAKDGSIRDTEEGVSARFTEHFRAVLLADAELPTVDNKRPLHRVRSRLVVSGSAWMRSLLMMKW